jgi:hypothetical protein
MQLYDPTVTGPERNFTRAAALGDLDGKTVGILENGKLNAVNMLRETAILFEQRHRCTIAPVYSKLNASAPAPGGTLEIAAKDVDFLITGLGD